MKQKINFYNIPNTNIALELTPFDAHNLLIEYFETNKNPKLDNYSFVERLITISILYGVEIYFRFNNKKLKSEEHILIQNKLKNAYRDNLINKDFYNNIPIDKWDILNKNKINESSLEKFKKLLTN